ncbi:MAG: BamA/TamA family outer membrane protein [candidate division WOR-3 bacterium]
MKSSYLAYLLLGIFCVFSLASAQYYFSKNKVQYDDLSFKTYDTEHFTIYFTDGGEILLEFASRYAEEFYKKLAADLGFSIKSKIPLIIYNSHNQFAQTNIILDIIEEAVGGFSELFKNRVVVPFDGSYENFRRVIEHEITHIFEFEMFYRARLLNLLTTLSDFNVPLWVMEGFSEFLSNEGSYNVEHETFLRDLILHNRFVSLDRLTDDMGYINYRLGQAFFDYMSQKYDRKKVFDFMQVLRNKRNLTQTFRTCFGLEISEFSEQLEEHLKIKYYPQITKRDNFLKIAKVLVDHKKDNSTYNAFPVISPSGTKIALVSDRSGYSDVYVISAIDGRVLKKLLKGERSGGFEAFSLLRPAIAWFPDEKALVVVTESQGKDELVIVSYPRGRVLKRLRFPLDALTTPAVSPDGSKIVFVGIKNGFADIYLTEINQANLIRLTYDYYDDRDPSFSPDGKKIVFVSDRPRTLNWQIGAYRIFELELTGFVSSQNSLYNIAPKIKEIPNLKAGSYFRPILTKDNKYLLFGAADSANNIYLYSILEAKLIARTDFAGSVQYFSLDTSGSLLVFSYFQNLGWNIGLIDEPIKNLPEITSDYMPVSQNYYEFEPTGVENSKVVPYQFNLTSDYAVGQASYSTGSGFSGQIAVSLSDVLGNHQFYLVSDLYQNIVNSEFLFNYWYLPKRTDLALALFQYFEYPVISESYVHLRRNRGVGIFLSYPFDKFSRIELGNINYLSYNETYRRIGNYWYPDENYRELMVLADEAFVYDNTIWNNWGPAQGTRFRLEGYQTLPLASRRFFTIYGDFRNYIRLTPRYIFATRFFNILSFGRDKENFAIGGELIRGYEYYEFYHQPSNILGFANLELRHPLIDKLKLAFPIPLELSNIRGVTFLDLGYIYNPQFVVYERGKGFKDLKIGAGFGLRIQISYFILKIDLAKPLSTTNNRHWKWYLSLGTDF